ncbi:hypothetical protein [Flavobacterium cerinum]|uniref:Lipoprotein n=1 Tax=Flavobacterium cerinum TaxID=2502784 RepID=A0ABY5ISS4_9FLAO|nr:hypothetical protein [Flavobacterium cerinum]UUC45202.1 hypothetical protein NOX80_16450 [Flavobacterium cerinum]
MRLFFYIIIFLTLISCSSKKETVLSDSIVKKECLLVEQNFDILNLSSNENELSNTELKSFNASEFRYDVFFHYLIEGTNNYFLERWYVDDNNDWYHIQIKKDEKKVSKIVFNEEETLSLFGFFESKSYIQDCKDCFGCKNYTLLIKKKGEQFKILANGNLFTDLRGNDKLKVEKYYNILQYFQEKK